MQGATTEAGIQRLVTGNRCEAGGCFEMAIWLVRWKASSSHWCAKHTIAKMCDASSWDQKSRINKIPV